MNRSWALHSFSAFPPALSGIRLLETQRYQIQEEMGEGGAHNKGIYQDQLRVNYILGEYHFHDISPPRICSLTTVQRCNKISSVTFWLE